MNIKSPKPEWMNLKVNFYQHIKLQEVISGWCFLVLFISMLEMMKYGSKQQQKEKRLNLEVQHNSDQLWVHRKQPETFCVNQTFNYIYTFLANFCLMIISVALATSIPVISV